MVPFKVSGRLKEEWENGVPSQDHQLDLGPVRDQYKATSNHMHLFQDMYAKHNRE